MRDDELAETLIHWAEMFNRELLFDCLLSGKQKPAETPISRGPVTPFTL